MALDGETPADKAGIKVEGGNKWIPLIQNAQVSKVNKEKKEMTSLTNSQNPIRSSF